MSTVNLYDVLNVEEDCSKKDIKKAYRKLVKTAHPDRGGDPDLFELITHAYNVLYNEDSRASYDSTYKVSKQAETNFEEMKDSFTEFIQAQDEDANKKTDQEIQAEFDISNAEFDAKHKFKRDELDAPALTKKEANARVADLTSLREQEDIEYEPENLFEGGDFDPNKFNEAWEKAYGDGPMSMVAHSGNPDAFGGTGDDFSGDYTSTNMDDIYNESDEGLDNTNYSSVNFGTTSHHITARDVQKMTGKNYVDRHREGADSKEYKKSLEDLIKQRELETHELEDMEMDDFVEDDTMGGYGISYQIGFEADQVTWDNQDNVRSQYKKLLKHRKEEAEEAKKAKGKETDSEVEMDPELLKKLRKERRRRRREERKRESES